MAAGGDSGAPAGSSGVNFRRRRTFSDV